MRKIIRSMVGKAIVPLALSSPALRSILQPVGLRATQDFFGGRVAPVEFPDGSVCRMTHLDESYLAFQLFWYGGQYYEPITRALVQELLRPGGVFIDIGAHVGFFSLTAAITNPQVQVIAFEPNPKNFRILKANLCANDINSVQCEPCAISDHNGMETLYLANSDMSASLVQNFQEKYTRSAGSVDVRVTSLDSYLSKFPARGPMVIKVDIEGHEPAFFKGAARSLETHHPDLILEVLDTEDAEIVHQLRTLGYHFYSISDEGLVEATTPKLVKRFPFVFLNYLISARPESEIQWLSACIKKRTESIDLLRTSKHRPPESWPGLWDDAGGLTAKEAPTGVLRSATHSP